MDKAGDEASFTSYGPTVVVDANGYEVESYIPGGDRLKMSGTSMASPNVANLAAKILAVNPKLTPRGSDRHHSQDCGEDGGRAPEPDRPEEGSGGGGERRHPKLAAGALTAGGRGSDIPHGQIRGPPLPSP